MKHQEMFSTQLNKKTLLFLGRDTSNGCYQDFIMIYRELLVIQILGTMFHVIPVLSKCIKDQKSLMLMSHYTLLLFLRSVSPEITPLEI